MACVIYLSALAMPAYNAIWDGILTVNDWKNPGDNLVTLDLVSGLEWLDLAATANRSYDDVVTNLGRGGDFEGWQLATADQVYALMRNTGVRLPDASGRDTATLAKTAAFNAFIGAQDLGAVTASRGLVNCPGVKSNEIGYIRVQNSTWEWSTKLCGPFPVNGVSEVVGTYLQRRVQQEPFVSAVA